ncbi:MAG: FAD-binding protein, partial [Proteobacteria bacterium]|nr:FAD-binding protein [Pseudomonadota bacterium]
SQAYWVDDVLERKAAEGRIHRADSLEALAAAMQVDATGLQGTIARYNQDAAIGRDSAFLKQGALSPVKSPPFYGVEVRPAIVCWTGTGLRIDADARVLTRGETPVTGLYAAGETVGNLHGDRYIGGGGSFGPCIVFGKIAGEHAARFVKSLNEQ